MWVYLLLLVIVFILLVIFSIYIIRLTHGFLKNHIKNKILCWILSFIPILLLGFGMMLDMANAIVVDIHLIVFVLLIKLIILISKKKVSDIVILSIGILITTLYLSYGYYQAYHVYVTNYNLVTNKDINKYRIVQISDSHIGTTFNGNGLLKYIVDINKLNPDIVVITGDFIDDSTSESDIIDGANALSKLNTKDGVYFIYGNHDKGYYSNKDTKLQEELKKNGVILLEDASVDLDKNMVLIGRSDASNKERISASDLTKEINKDKYIIMLDHQPTDYDNEKDAGVDLVLSGHTHGGQLIPLGQFGLLLGANDSIYGLKTIENTNFIVNSGISDWAIKFKTGTKSEYVVVDLKKK